MYLKNIAIKNIGPIDELVADLPFNDNGNPKPLLFVGENGTGKTILLSQVIDSFYEIGSQIFDDIGNQDGLKRSYYKVSGGLNLKNGKSGGFSFLSFMEDEGGKLEYFDKAGEVKKDDVDNLINGFSLNLNEKNTTQIDETRKKNLQDEWMSGAYFYQPAYRYEEPFWKNEPFIEAYRFEDKKRFSNKLNKEIEIISSTKNNKSFLMDLVLDFTHFSSSQSNDILVNIRNKIKKNENIELSDLDIQWLSYDQITWGNINTILQKIKKREDIRFGIGPRSGSRVSIVEQDLNGNSKNILLPSIDNLSLGESILLNFFVNIIRHADMPPKPLEEIRGIVAIDEIDVHLHTDLQYAVLPALIKTFPKIQFIITTHSPLFILGMEKELGENGFELRNMPDGEKISTERFSEFEKAYKVLNDTKKFEDDIDSRIKNTKKPIVFVEGDYDIRYIRKACELYGKAELFNGFEFIDAEGYKNLDNIWNHKSNLFNAIHQNMLLLYDCDTKVLEGQRGKIFKKIIPYKSENYFDRGIENLFSIQTINKAIDFKPAFIDITTATTKTIRGVTETIPEKYEVNKDEKGNLCNWLCEYGTLEDFGNFKTIFEILENFLNESAC